MQVKKLGQLVSKGFLEGMKSVERERTANNALKMSGMPMRRKKSRKDRRGKIRKNIINMERLFKI